MRWRSCCDATSVYDGSASVPGPSPSGFVSNFPQPPPLTLSLRDSARFRQPPRRPRWEGGSSGRDGLAEAMRSFVLSESIRRLRIGRLFYT
jgi:hypothetical protein